MRSHLLATFVMVARHMNVSSIHAARFARGPRLSAVTVTMFGLDIAGGLHKLCLESCTCLRKVHLIVRSSTTEWNPRKMLEGASREVVLRESQCTALKDLLLILAHIPSYAAYKKRHTCNIMRAVDSI